MHWQRLTVALGAVVLLGDTCALPGPYRRVTPDHPTPMQRESVSMQTQDGVQLAGDWYPVDAPRGWALLLHMMPATKESYAGLAAELQRRNIASLAIDFRGHGASQGGPKGYERFSDAEQQAKRRDVETAYHKLVELAATSGATGTEDAERNPYDIVNPRVVVVGASIGANLALQFLRDNPTIAGAILLSPGLEYRGVRTNEIARDIVTNRQQNTSLPATPILLAAGGAGDEYSTDTVHQLATILGNRATVRTFASASHGTALFEREPTFLTEVAEWIVTHTPTQ